MEKINTAWTAASEEMYKASQEEGAAAEGNQTDEATDDVTDVEFEEVKEEEVKETVKFTRREFNYASFKRSFNLPESVDTAKITASYTDGVLAVSLPKREEAQVQPSRLIEIQ